MEDESPVTNRPRRRWPPSDRKNPAQREMAEIGANSAFSNVCLPGVMYPKKAKANDSRQCSKSLSDLDGVARTFDFEFLNGQNADAKPD